jgi:hypothetical protein
MAINIEECMELNSDFTFHRLKNKEIQVRA